MSYLLIDLSVHKANMLQSPSILAPTPVFAAVMAAHALDMELGKKLGKENKGGLGVNGVGLIHLYYSPWVEVIGNDKGYLEDPILVQRRGSCLFGDGDFKKDTGNGPQQNSVQPMALADYEWQLLLSCDRQPDPKTVADTLRSMRFAGGIIKEVNVERFDSWSEAMASIHTGYWIDDVSDLLIQGDDPIGALLLLVSQRSDWVLPSTLGYAMLELPSCRKGARDEKLHAFAEHMVGAVKLTSVRKRKNEDLSPQNLWRSGWDGSQFIVTNRPSVVLNTSHS
jgi:hypothetical protein